MHWTEEGQERSAHWLSESDADPAARIVVADDYTTADEAYGLACQGAALLWRGDFHNARQLLNALARRVERGRRKRSPVGLPAALTADTFHRYRQAQSHRARVLAAVLIPLGADYGIPLRRAPDIREACVHAWGPTPGNAVTSLRALLGAIGAHEWRLKGIEVPAAGGRIHPHYGVFAPIRSEYVDLLAGEPLPPLQPGSVAFDIGTGTGVLAAVLARRGLQRVVATDADARALSCARENLDRLGFAKQVQVVSADLFPEGRADLIVCNPPWVPARPSSALERGIYDPDSQMLRGFLNGLAAHLEPQGQGWLILSDLAEHLGLRPRTELLAAFDAAGLKVLGRGETRPHHRRASDPDDPLHAARAAEVTSLWRLGPR